MTTLPSLKVHENTNSLMNRAIEIYNQKNLMQMSKSDFRRLSYELLSRMIIEGKELPVRLR